MILQNPVIFGSDIKILIQNDINAEIGDKKRFCKYFVIVAMWISNQGELRITKIVMAEDF